MDKLIKIVAILSLAACTVSTGLTETTDGGTDMAVAVSPPGPDMSMAFPSGCSDKLKDGDETDTDCGGSCAPCGTGQGCIKSHDCQSLICDNSACAAPACNDGFKNGTESDVDCGGSCPGCPIGKACVVAADCTSANCVNNVCQISPCMNGVKDGMETDVDCGGGTCPPCADTKMCNVAGDCVGKMCINQVCSSPLNCMAPMANCDNNPKSGCNINLNGDPNNCGKCGMVCPMMMANCSGGTCVAGIKVLIISNGQARLYQDVQAKLMATGAFSSIDVADEGQSTPTVGQMQMHDVVFVFTTTVLRDPPTLGNNLATYFDAGGRVVLGFSANEGNIAGPTGAFAANGYLLMGSGQTLTPNDTLGAINDPNSPLMAGVKSLSGKSIPLSNGGLVNGAVSVVDWQTTKLPIIVTGLIKGKHRVDLNFFPPSNDVSPGSWTGDGAVVMRNALLFQ